MPEDAIVKSRELLLEYTEASPYLHSLELFLCLLRHLAQRGPFAGWTENVVQRGHNSGVPLRPDVMITIRLSKKVDRAYRIRSA